MRYPLFGETVYNLQYIYCELIEFEYESGQINKLRSQYILLIKIHYFFAYFALQTQR